MIDRFRISDQMSYNICLLKIHLILNKKNLFAYRYICTDVTNRFSIHKDYQAYNALNGNSISLPCNITPPSSDDGVSLILWYRDDLSTPIYTVDARSVGHLQSAKHFNDVSVLTNRATFNITYPVSYLRFNPAVETDTAEYRCRVDFRRGRTINRVMQLNVIGKFK